MRGIAFILIGMFGGLLILTNACDNVRLNLSVEPEVVNLSSKLPEICTAPPTESDTVTKVLFLVDQSGSNQSGNNGGVGTDPDKSFRDGLIREFLNRRRGTPGIEWGFISFYQNAARAFINDGNDANAIFTPDASQMDAALARMNATADNGSTPYRSAFGMATTAIDADRLRDAARNPFYIVVLITDGVPTDYGNPIDENAVDNSVRQLVQAGAGSLILSTVYYGPPSDGSAASRLERMARLGNGKFADRNLQGTVPIDDLITGRKAEPWYIKRFVVSNLNSAPCEDGSINADSDADGICDVDELRFNAEADADTSRSKPMTQRMNGRRFQIDNRNSFNDRYNDGVYLRYLLYGDQVNLGCNQSTDDDHDLLNGCEEEFMRVSTKSGPTKVWEELMDLTADPKNFDSDGDGFIDWFEFVWSGNRFGVMDYNNTAAIVQGYRMDEIYLQHRNWRNPRIAGQPYDGDFRFLRVNEKGQNCYTYKQDTLPLFQTVAVQDSKVSGHRDLAHAANENVIMLYYIQAPEANMNGAGELKYQFQKFKVENANATIDSRMDAFKSYRAVEARVSSK